MISGQAEKFLGALIGEKLLVKGRTVACAESCTGGLLTSCLTDIPGSSAYVKGAVVSYTNEVKAGVLGVKQETLDSLGAVSEKTAVEMAEGVRKKLCSDYALSVTGNAGPGASEGKPVGLVFIGFASETSAFAKKFNFSGTRIEIKKVAVHEAMKLLNEELEK